MSNTGMEHPNTPNLPKEPRDGGDTTERRLTELEIKASFAEDLLEQLDKIIVRQQQQIDALLREVAELKAAPVRDGDITTARSLRDELPPHF
jgi:SlyX protein